MACCPHRPRQSTAQRIVLANRFIATPSDRLAPTLRRSPDDRGPPARRDIDRRRWTMRVLSIRAAAVASLLALAAAPARAQDKEATYQGKTVKEWTAALKSADARLRLWGAVALAEAGMEAAPAAG